MTAKDFFTKIWTGISKMWTTRVGKIILLIVYSVGCFSLGGGTGYISGCTNQAKKTATKAEQLKELKKEAKAKDAEIAKLEKEVAEQQALIDKKIKKKK